MARHRASIRSRNSIVHQLMTLTAMLGWLSLTPVVWRLRRGLVSTSLSGLWRLVGAGWLAWGVAGAASLVFDLSAGAIDLLWYSVAVLLLLPPIAVLGARRPIDRVWPWFVLLPLAGVFAWPVLSALGRGRLPVTWNIEAPMLMAYALVLVMGAGNYLGLRQTLPAILWIASLALLVGPLCPLTANALPTAPDARLFATLTLTASGWLALATARNRNQSPARQGRPEPPISLRRNGESPEVVSPGDTAVSIDHGDGVRSAEAPEFAESENSSRLDSLWRDFRDTFGIVWARRMQERFNDMMRQQGHSIRLGIDGLEQAEGNPDIPFTGMSAAETSLCWLLQKFVDREWIVVRVDVRGADPFSPP